MKCAPLLSSQVNLCYKALCFGTLVRWNMVEWFGFCYLEALIRMDATKEALRRRMEAARLVGH